MFDQFTEYGANFNDGKVDIKYFQKAANITFKLLYLKVLGNLRIMNTNIKFLFKTSQAGWFWIEILHLCLFLFMFVICKLPNNYVIKHFKSTS